MKNSRQAKYLQFNKKQLAIELLTWAVVISGFLVFLCRMFYLTPLPIADKMSANSSLCFTLSGLGFWLSTRPINLKSSKTADWACMFCVTIVFFLVFISLVEHGLGYDWGIDHLFLGDKQNYLISSQRMAPMTALNFILLCLILMLSKIKSRYEPYIREILAVIILGISTLALFGYGYSPDALTQLPMLASMAELSALLFILLAFGLLFVNKKVVSVAGRYGFAIILVALSFQLYIRFSIWFGRGLPPFITFYPSVIIIALLGGVRAGALAITLSAVIVGIWIFEPVGALSINEPIHRISIILFIVNGILINTVVGLYHRYRYQSLVNERDSANKVLYATHQQLKALMNALPVGVCFSEDATCERISANPAGLKLFEAGTADNLSASAPEAETTGRQLRYFKNGQPLSVQELPLQRAITENREISPMEIEVRLPSGQYRYMSATAAPIIDQTGKITGAVAVTMDISERKQAELALRDSQQQLALALEAGQLGFWDWDVSSGKVQFGGNWAAMLGYELDEIEPDLHAWERLIHPDDRTAVFAKLADHLEGRTEFYECEHRLQHKDGTWHWVLDRGKVVEQDDNGQPRRAIGTHADITERYKAENTLRKSELRHRTLVETASAITWFCPPSGLHVEPQPEWMKFTGQTAEEMLGDGWTKAVYPDDLYEAGVKWQETVVQEGVFVNEHRIRRHDGQWRWMNVRIVPIRNNTGKVVEWFGTNIDITERKQYEERLKKSEEQFRAVFENAGIGIAIRDLQGKFQNCNPAYCQLLGYTEAELQALDFQSLVYQDDREENLAQIDFLEEEKSQLFDIETRYVRKDGIPVWVRKCVTYLHDETGQPSNLVMLITDVSDRHLVETLTNADQRKDEFLAMLGHELRNPLAPISTVAQILVQEKLDEKTFKWASQLLIRNVEIISRLVNDLLDVSRITRGLVRIHQKPIELNKVLIDAIEPVLGLISAKRQTLGQQIPTQPILIEGDEVRLAQIFTNLLNNASKYSNEDGNIQLSVTSDENNAIVTVSDNGIGLPPDLLPNVFDLFTQGKQGLARSEGGMGIGLSLVKKLVELHKGSIIAHSEGENQGSTFKVILPKISPKKLQVELTASKTEEDASPRPLKVLIIDDNADIAEAIGQLLSLSKHEIRIAHTASEGITENNRFSPDVIFMDIGLPDMSGYELAEKFRALPQGDQLCLVALSGYVQDKKDRAANLNFNHYFLKPVDIDHLRQVLTNFQSGGNNETNLQ